MRQWSPALRNFLLHLLNAHVKEVFELAFFSEEAGLRVLETAQVFFECGVFFAESLELERKLWRFVWREFLS